MNYNYWYFNAPRGGWKGKPHFVGTCYRMTMLGDFTKAQAIKEYVKHFKSKPQGEVYQLNPV